MKTQAPPPTAIAILEEACSRNLSVELHYLNYGESSAAADAELAVAHSRFLSVDAQKVCLDSPQRNGKPVCLERGRQVVAFFTLQEKMYTFRSPVAASATRININREKSIIGTVLETPEKIGEGQRREDYRVSLAAVGPPRAALHEASADNPDCCPLAARRFSGFVVNLSRGGAAVRVEGEARHEFRHGQKYFLSFRLDDDEEELAFLAQVRHVQTIRDGEAGVVGFQFLRWPDAHQLHRQVTRLGRYLAESERRRLRNVRDR